MYRSSSTLGIRAQTERCFIKGLLGLYMYVKIDRSLDSRARYICGIPVTTAEPGS